MPGKAFRSPSSRCSFGTSGISAAGRKSAELERSMLTHHPPPAPSRRTLAVVPDHLQQVAATSSEAKQMSAQRVAAQHLLHLERQARKALPHVGVPRGQPDPYAGRNGDHRRRLVLASALSSADTVDASTDLHPTAGRELDLDRARLLRRRHWQRWSCCLRHGRNCYRAERDGRRRTFAALAATGTAAWHVSRLRAQPPRPPHPAPVPPR